MTIGPEPMIRIFLRSVRLGTQAPRPRRLFFDQPKDDRRLRHGLFTAIEDIVQTPLADPDDLAVPPELLAQDAHADRKSTRLNSSHGYISYAVFCLKKKKTKNNNAIANVL